MDTKFTPGEWKQTPDGYRVFEMHGSLAHEIVCWTAGNNKQRTQKARDRARLIAAAPDMYEALQYALKELTACKDLGMSLNKSIELATAALAKVQS